MCCSLEGSRTKNLSFGERPVCGRVSTISCPSAPRNPSPRAIACSISAGAERFSQSLPTLIFSGTERILPLLLQRSHILLSRTRWASLQAARGACVQCRAHALDDSIPGLCGDYIERRDCSPSGLALSFRFLRSGPPRRDHRRRRRSYRKSNEDRGQQHTHWSDCGSAQCRSLGLTRSRLPSSHSMATAR